jgi:hypothetical protein
MHFKIDQTYKVDKLVTATKPSRHLLPILFIITVVTASGNIGCAFFETSSKTSGRGGVDLDWIYYGPVRAHPSEASPITDRITD